VQGGAAALVRITPLQKQMQANMSAVGGLWGQVPHQG
jgi:hypothetical protein